MDCKREEKRREEKRREEKRREEKRREEKRREVLPKMLDNNFTFNLTERKELQLCLDYAFCHRYKTTNGFLETTFLQFTIIVLISLASVIINGFFILMMYLLAELRGTSNCFLLNIALVNSTFGLGSLIACSVYYKELIDCTVNVCLYRVIYVHISGTGMALTMTTLTVISIERYICIFYPLRWSQIITARRVVVVLVSLWIFWIGFSSVCRATNTWKLFQILYMTQALFNMVVITIINIVIFREIRRHERNIAHEQQMAPNAEEIRRAREKKRAKTIILMTTLVVIGYLPSLVLVIGYRVPSIDQVNWQYAWLVCRTIFLSHTAFDIIVYGLRTEETRRGVRKVLRRFACCSKQE